MHFLMISSERASCKRLETWKYAGDVSTQKSLTKQSCCSILMGVSAYTMGAMATVRGVPDWIWLSGQQGWARQMRTRSPHCVRVCTCVHAPTDIECKQYRERERTECCMGPWVSNAKLETVCNRGFLCVGVRCVFWKHENVIVLMESC